MTVLWVILGYFVVAAVVGKFFYMWEQQAAEKDRSPQDVAIAGATLVGFGWPLAAGVLIVIWAQRFWIWWFNCGLQSLYRRVKRRRMKRTNWIDGN